MNVEKSSPAEHKSQTAMCGRLKASETASSLKVAYIMSRFPKLTETFILNEILALEAQGVTVEIYPLLKERQSVVHPEAKKLVRRAHFHPFVSLPILRAQFYFLRRNPFTYFKLWFEVLRGTLGSLNFFLGALGIFPKVVRFAYEMERLEITHIHAHFATHPALAALIIHRLTGISFSFTAHGSDLHVDRRMLDKKLEAAAFAVAISSYNKELMIEECGEWARKKIHVVHCGVDPSIFSPRPETPVTERFRILCVASFEEVKGHRYLIEACRILRDRGIEFECSFVGGGPLRSKIEAHMVAVNLRELVGVHGALSQPQVALMMSRSDVVALASVPTRSGKREGIPVVLMEAMATGLPVVASRISGIPELVESGCSGLLVPPADAVALADALQTLATDRELCSRMGRAGREKVQRQFNLHTNASGLLRLFLAEKNLPHSSPADLSAPFEPSSSSREYGPVGVGAEG